MGRKQAAGAKGNITPRTDVKTPGFRPVANTAFHLAMVDISRSSATARHTPKPHKGTRTAKNRKALAEW